jgi:hypothetical protein
VPSSDNVRKTGAKEGIESLAANIQAIGLLQNLRVRQTATVNTKRSPVRTVTPTSNRSSNKKARDEAQETVYLTTNGSFSTVQRNPPVFSASLGDGRRYLSTGGKAGTIVA